MSRQTPPASPFKQQPQVLRRELGASVSSSLNHSTNSAPNSRTGHTSPTPSMSNRASPHPVGQAATPISSGPRGTPTIAGEPLHDLGRALGLLKASKFYSEGFLMKRVETGPDGKPTTADSQWSKWFVQLTGTIMSTWNAGEMEEAARENRTVPPQYLNLADAFLHPYPANPNGPMSPTEYRFALNSAGLNRILFCASSLESMSMWINAIRLAGWERSRCNEIYTGTLLGLREPKGGWVPPDTMGGKLEGWVKARLPGDTEWRRVWVILMRGVPPASSLTVAKKTKRTSIFGKKPTADVPLIDNLPGDGTLTTLAFFDEKPNSRKEKLLCIAQHLYYVSAIFPETEQLIDSSSLFKVEGTFLNPNDGYKGGWGVGGRAEKQGYALLMLDEGDSLAMLQWIVGLADAFKLYGWPRGFSFDPRDPSSLYFALPVGPHSDRQFLDRELVDTLKMDESRPRAIRAVFHNILFDRMRGVRPTALEEPAPPPGRESFEDLGRSQPEQGARQPEQGMRPPLEDQRRWSQLPQQVQQRDQSRTLSPLFLPPIGEGSVEEPPQEVLYRQPVSGGQSTSSSLQSRGHPIDVVSSQVGGSSTSSTRNTTPDYLGNAGVPLPAPTAQHASDQSETADVLADYTTFIQSDLVSKPPEPTYPLSQTQSFRTSTSSFAPNSPPPGPSTINTASANDVGRGTTNYSRPRNLSPSPGTSVTSVTETETGASDLTHLTYAPPRPEQAYADRPRKFYESSPPATFDDLSSLPSPGAASLASPGRAQADSESDGLAYLSQNHPQNQLPYQSNPTAVKVPAPTPSTASQPPRAVYRQDSFDFQPPVAGPSGEPPRYYSPRSPSTTTTPVVVTPVVRAAELPAVQSSPSSKAPSTKSPSIEPTDSSNEHFYSLQVHNGSVVDSPESLHLASPVDSAFNTKPLFSSSQPPAVPAAGAIPSPPSQETQAHVEAADAKTSVAASPTVPVAVPAAPEPPLAVHTRGLHKLNQSTEDIHSDLLAALDFVDRNGSPPPDPVPESPSTVGATSPVAERPLHVGPPSRHAFLDAPPPAAPVDEEEYAPSPSASSPTTAEPRPVPASFPSTFAKNKRAEERVAASQEAELAKRAAVTRPGRTSGTNQKKKGLWEDSDEEEEPEEDEDEDEDDESAEPEDVPVRRNASLEQPVQEQYDERSPSPPRQSRALPLPPPSNGGYSSQDQFASQQAARQSYYENGPSGSTSPRPLSPPLEQPRDVSPARPVGRPVVSPHGLLHAGIIEKEERSARALEFNARDTGGPLVNLPSKPPPPQTGLVGALTSHEREKERTGGVGRALTEQQRERRLAEQRQKQLDELQKIQLQQQQQAMGYGAGGYNPMMGGYNPMMNPWGMQMGGMQMGGGIGMGGGMPMGYGSMAQLPQSPIAGGSQIGVPASTMGGGLPSLQQPSMDAQQQAQQAQHATMQQHAMMAAQMAAQQAYQMAMAQIQSPPLASPGGSPMVGAMPYPQMGGAMPFMGYPPSTFGVPSPGYPASSFGGPSPGFPASPSFGGSQLGGFPGVGGYGAGPGSSFGAGSQYGFNPYAAQQQQQQQQASMFGLQQPPSGVVTAEQQQQHESQGRDARNEGSGATSPLELSNGAWAYENRAHEEE